MQKSVPLIHYVVAPLALFFIVAWYFGDWLLRKGATVLVVSQKPEPADAIVIMLGGKQPERIRKAVQLYQAGYAPLVVFGSGYYHRDIRSNLEIEYEWAPSANYEKRLKQAGVPSEKMVIIPTPNAYDTATEIEDLARGLKARQWKKVLLISSATHTRRLGLIWRRVSPDIRARIVGANDPRLMPWWGSLKGIKTVGREYLGFLKEYGRRAVAEVSGGG